MVDRETSIQSCLSLKSNIRLHHPYPYPPIIGAVESPNPPPTSSLSHRLIPSKPQKYHLQHIAGFHSHTHLTTHPLARGTKPPHTGNGVRRDKLGRKNRRRVIVSRFRSVDSRRRLQRPLRAVIGRSVGCRRCVCLFKQRFCVRLVFIAWARLVVWRSSWRLTFLIVTAVNFVARVGSENSSAAASHLPPRSLLIAICQMHHILMPQRDIVLSARRPPLAFEYKVEVQERRLLRHEVRKMSGPGQREGKEGTMDAKMLLASISLKRKRFE